MTRISINLLGIDRKEALQRSGLNIDKGIAVATASIIIALLLLFGSNALVSSWLASAEELKEENTQKIAVFFPFFFLKIQYFVPYYYVQIINKENFAVQMV